MRTEPLCRMLSASMSPMLVVSGKGNAARLRRKGNHRLGEAFTAHGTHFRPPRAVSASAPASRGRAAGTPASGPYGTATDAQGRRTSAPEVLKVFPEGFRDETYLDFERDYKWNAHHRWAALLSEDTFGALIRKKKFADVAAMAITIESRTNLLFSFEKMALRDAVRSPAGAKAFALALFDFLHGQEPLEARFDRWVAAVARLPRRKTRVLTWPLVTVFGFIAQPRTPFMDAVQGLAGFRGSGAEGYP